jgi:hypothetical protein
MATAVEQANEAVELVQAVCADLHGLLPVDSWRGLLCAPAAGVRYLGAGGSQATPHQIDGRPQVRSTSRQSQRSQLGRCLGGAPWYRKVSPGT